MAPLKILCICKPEAQASFDTTPELYNRFAESPVFTLYHAASQSIDGSASIRCAEIASPLAFPDYQHINDRCNQLLPVTHFDVCLDRTDEPLPANFYEHLGTYESVLPIVNRPSALLSARTKMFLSGISGDMMPANIFTRDIEEAREFIARHGTVVVKANRSYGGKGVFRVTTNDPSRTVHVSRANDEDRTFPSVQEALEHIFALDPDPFQIMRYLKNVGQGDKRVLVLPGQILGGYLRKSADGGWVNNITSGGKAFSSDVGSSERRIIETIGPRYYDRGIHMLGFDFLMDDGGDWTLSEVNCGNVGGYGRLESLSGAPIYRQLLEWIESGVRERRFFAMPS